MESDSISSSSLIDNAACIINEPLSTSSSTKWVKNTNQIFLSVKVDNRNGRIIILSVIDNLLKGQAGQAIQNLNIMSVFSMDEGLDLTNNFP